jgi:hypothetical protein
MSPQSYVRHRASYHERAPLKKNIGDVKDRQKPLVLRIGHVKRLAHAGRVGIADVATVKNRAEVCNVSEDGGRDVGLWLGALGLLRTESCYQGNDVPVQFPN